MEFVNETGFAADLARTCLFYRDLTMAVAIVKCGFRITESGDVIREDQPSPILETDVNTKYGTIDADGVPQKRGCDLSIFGCARPFPPSPVPQLDIELQMGALRRTWRVFGDREWRAVDGGFAASAPTPFSEMLISNDKAYGGTAIAQGRFTVRHPENPEGKGYGLLAEHMAGTALPNLEDPTSPVRTWTDRPASKGLTPISRESTLRGARGLNVDLEARRTTLDAAFFCSSHPDLWLDHFPAGERFTLKGMGHLEQLSFVVPDIRLALHLDLGGRIEELDLLADTLHVYPDDARFEVVVRRALVYQFIPERRRILTIKSDTARRAAGTTTTIRRAQQDATLGVAILPEDEDSPIPFEILKTLNPITDLIESLPLCLSA